MPLSVPIEVTPVTVDENCAQLIALVPIVVTTEFTAQLVPALAVPLVTAI